MKNEELLALNIDNIKIALEEKAKTTVNEKNNLLLEKLFALKEQILLLRTKKMSWQKIADILKENGFAVSAATVASAFKDDNDFQKVKNPRKQKETS